MTFDTRQVSQFKLSLQKHVSNANGIITSIIGEGSLQLTYRLNLNFVAIVLSLNYNLLYVSQITTYLLCYVIFGLIVVCLKISKRSKRLVMVLDEAICITWR